MIHHDFEFCDQKLQARASGVLWWDVQRLLVVSDLHLGKSERIARRGGTLLPPFEGVDTITRLANEINSLNPDQIICLGDSFDDLEALESLPLNEHRSLTAMMAGRDWIWIEGNHDAGPIDLGGTHIKEVKIGDLTFRHIAETAANGEISGHYHPKARIAARGRSMSKPCFVIDEDRIIMPAFGTYTGGLFSDHDAIQSLIGPNAKAVMIGDRTLQVPLRHSV